MGVPSDGQFGKLCLFILDEGVGDIVFFFLEDQGLDGPELAKLPTDVVLLDLDC